MKVRNNLLHWHNNGRQLWMSCGHSSLIYEIHEEISHHIVENKNDLCIKVEKCMRITEWLRCHIYFCKYCTVNIILFSVCTTPLYLHVLVRFVGKEQIYFYCHISTRHFPFTVWWRAIFIQYLSYCKLIPNSIAMYHYLASSLSTRDNRL